MSTATKVIRQIAAGQVTGQSLRKKADQVVASSTCTTCRADANGKPNARRPDSREALPKDQELKDPGEQSKVKKSRVKSPIQSNSSDYAKFPQNRL